MKNSFHLTLFFVFSLHSTVHRSYIYASTKQIIIIFNVVYIIHICGRIERAHISSISSLEYRFSNNGISFRLCPNVYMHSICRIQFRQLLDPFTPPSTTDNNVCKWMNEKIEFQIKNSLLHYRLDNNFGFQNTSNEVGAGQINSKLKNTQTILHICEWSETGELTANHPFMRLAIEFEFDRNEKLNFRFTDSLDLVRIFDDGTL